MNKIDGWLHANSHLPMKYTECNATSKGTSECMKLQFKTCTYVSVKIALGLSNSYQRFPNNSNTFIICLATSHSLSTAVLDRFIFRHWRFRSSILSWQYFNFPEIAQLLLVAHQVPSEVTNTNTQYPKSFKEVLKAPSKVRIHDYEAIVRAVRPAAMYTREPQFL